MIVKNKLWATFAVALLGGVPLLATDPAPAPAKKTEAALIEYFEKHVRPILANNCYNCHSATTNAKGGLRVDDRRGLLQGGNRGPAVVPGSPEKSLLLQAVAHTHKAVKMPPGKQLAQDDVEILTRWIRDGAAWPQVELPANLGKIPVRYERLRQEHWAWQPLAKPAVPAVKDAAWPADDIDRFLLAALEAKGLKPVRDADKVALLRRVTFDLTGLPPTPAEIEAFTNDPAADAFAKVVDRLLALPAYGERWGRHWLDVARYGESSGSSRNLPLPYAWRYRDYVIDAFNKDKPYDRFIREQIAGDLLPAATPEQKDEQIIATGFLALGVKDVNQRFKVRFIMDNVDEQIDTVTRSILGLTASCARCHDHKFDPIPTADYYALAGIFTSSDLCSGLKNKMGGGGLDYYEPSLLIPLSAAPQKADDPATLAKIAKLQKAHDLAKQEFEALRGTPEGKKPGLNGKAQQQNAKKKFMAADQQLIALTDPAANGFAVMGVRDSKVIADTEIRIRGEAEQIGPSVPRGFLSVVNVPGSPKVNPAQSGRLELAEWLVSPKNPLASRVIVNRIWHYLFNQGIVTTVDNFGVNGDVPSNPQLLDHLAQRFIDDGWSIKKLVRTIVLSRAYRLSAESTPEHLTQDPANRLVWRHNPRRLEAEEIRDATLAIAGTLDPTRPAGSPAQVLKVIEMRNNGPEARQIEDAAAASVRRSVYLPLVRGLVPRPLEVFDFAEQGMVTGQRDATTVAPQALYMLNDPFVRRQALAFAERLLTAKGDDDNRIQLAYRHAFGRDATTSEIERTKSFLRDYEPLAKASIAQNGKPAPKNDGPAPAPKKEQPANPDEIDQTDEPIREEAVVIRDSRTAAWAAFTQALIGAAEFRFLK